MTLNEHRDVVNKVYEGHWHFETLEGYSAEEYEEITNILFECILDREMAGLPVSFALRSAANALQERMNAEYQKRYTEGDQR